VTAPTPSDPTLPEQTPEWLPRVLERLDQSPGSVVADLPQFFLHHGPTLAVGLAAAASAVLWGRQRLAAWRLGILWHDARLIRVVPPPEVEAPGAVAFWANLVGLLRPAWRRALTGQPHVAFEYVWDSAGARLQMWVPGVIPPGLIERAVEAAWPGTHATATPADPTSAAPIPDVPTTTGGTLRLAQTEILPLAVEHDTDPLRALFAAASGLQPHQHAVVQILARPVTGRRRQQARHSVRQLRLGKSTNISTRLLDTLTPGPGRLLGPGASGRPNRAGSTRTASDPERTAQVRAAVAKTAGPSWEVLIRYALADATPDQPDQPGLSPATGRSQVARRQELAARNQRVNVLRGRAHAVASSFALYSGMNFLTRRKLRRPGLAVATRALPRGDLYGVAELAAVAHLPVDPATPGLARAGARAVPPPPDVPTSPSPQPARPAATRPPGGPEQQEPGSEDDPAGQAVKILGDTDTGTPRQAGLRVADARHHLHVIGATGSGKSTLMLHNVLDDVRHGRGAVVIDPKGDLVLDILDRLPVSAGRRLALIDPDDPAPPPCLNPLDLAPGEDMDTAVDNLVGIFRRIFSGFWGPRTDDVLRAACLTLLRAPRSTLLAARAQDTLDIDGDVSEDYAVARSRVPTLADIPRLLDDDTYRRTLTEGITDEVLRGFWAWYDRLGAGPRANATGPVLNKLRAFLLRSFVREAIASGPATLDMSRALDGGIALIRLPKGILGEETSRLLGSFVVARTWQAASARARAGKHRIDSSLSIDEAHNFLNLPYPIEDMLAEARGYRLSMTIAHQNLAQMPREMREGVSANARNKIIFNASPEDARDLERHTRPTLVAHDLSHLGAFQAAARLVTRSADAPAFTLRTRPMPARVTGRAEQLRRLANSPAPTPGTTSSPGTSDEGSRSVPAAGQPTSARSSTRQTTRPDVRLQFTRPVEAEPASPAQE
jgi:hypothetical protein